MAEPCFIKKNSAPPARGVPDVRLVERQSPDDLATSRYGEFAYLVCRRSGQFLNDEEKLIGD
jgi:hypothetical protein